MFNKIKDWIVHRQIRALEQSIIVIEQIISQNAGTPQEVLDNIKKIDEELSVVELLYRKNIKKNEHEVLCRFLGMLEKIWRPRSGLESYAVSTLDKKEFIATAKTVLEILNKLLSIHIYADNILAPPNNTSKYVMGGIWNLPVILLMRKFHDVFKNDSYCFVGGIAVQLIVANSMHSELSQNEKLRSVCRFTHDIDVIFPEGFSFDPHKLASHGEFEGIKYTITIDRQASKRPLASVNIQSSKSKSESYKIYLNITTSHRDAKGLTNEQYIEEFRNTRALTCYFSGKACTFRCLDSNHIILSKIYRLNSNDIYDIRLLLTCDPEINFDYLLENSPNDCLQFLMQIHKTA